MNLIILTGKAGSGKSTVAEFLRHKGYKEVAIASPIKEMLAMAGYLEPVLREDKERNYISKNYSFRTLAQTLGEWGRGNDENFWLDVALGKVVDYLQGGHPVVVSDARYDNEVEALKDLGGSVVKIVGRSSDLGDAAKHSSEQLEVEADFVLNNNADFDHLKLQIARLLNHAQLELPF